MLTLKVGEKHKYGWILRRRESVGTKTLDIWESPKGRKFKVSHPITDLRGDLRGEVIGITKTFNEAMELFDAASVRLILYEKSDHVATITLNRPEAFNSISPELYKELSDTMIRFRDDPDVWVAIITGAGQKAFSAGADIKKMLPRLADKSFVLPPGIMRGLNIWKPIIAAVNGLALGGGLEIVLACDIRIAAKNARFGTPEVGLGLIPGWGGTQRLPRMLPWCKAAEILLTGKPIDAEEAYRIGLINKVVDQEELMSTAQEWAAKICENGPIAVRAAKEAMIRGMNMSLDDGLRLEESFFAGLTTTADFEEGISAFAEKRKSQFKGE